MRGKYPRACAVFRIFTTLMYRSTFRSSRRRSRWMIPSERKSSPFSQNLSLSCCISVISRDVIPRSRSHSNRRKSSSRGSSNFPMTSSTGRESITRREMSTVLSRFSMYILKTSIHDLFESCFSFFRIRERSSTLSFFSSPVASIPRPAMFARRDSRLCSRVTYTAPRPSFFALPYSMLKEIEDFIDLLQHAVRQREEDDVPGGDAALELLVEPAHVRPDPILRHGLPRWCSVALYLFSPPPGVAVLVERPGRHEAEDTAEDDQEARGRARYDQDRDSGDDVDDAARPVLAAIDEQGAADCDEREHGVDRDASEPDDEVLVLPRQAEVDQHEERPDEAEEEGEHRQQASLRHRGRRIPHPLSSFWAGYPFSNPASAKIPFGSPPKADEPRTMRPVRNPSRIPARRAASTAFSFTDGAVKPHGALAAENIAWSRSSACDARSGGHTTGPTSQEPSPTFPNANAATSPMSSRTREVSGNSPMRRRRSRARSAPK